MPTGGNTLPIDNQAAVSPAYVEALKLEFNQNFPKLARSLTSASSAAPANVTVILREFTGTQAGGVAFTSGNQIHINAGYIRSVGL